MEQNNNPYGQQSYIPETRFYSSDGEQSQQSYQQGGQANPYAQENPYQQSVNQQSVPDCVQAYQPENWVNPYDQGAVPDNTYQQYAQEQSAVGYQQGYPQDNQVNPYDQGVQQGDFYGQLYQQNVQQDYGELQQSPYEQQSIGQQKKKLNPLVIILPIAAVVIIALVVALVIVLSGFRSSSKPGKTDSNESTSTTSSTKNNDIAPSTEKEEQHTTTKATETEPEEVRPVPTYDVRDYNNENPYNISILDSHGNDVSNYVTIKRGDRKKIANKLGNSADKANYNGSIDFVVGEPFMVEYEGADYLEIVYDLPDSLLNASSGGLYRFYVYYYDEKKPSFEKKDRAILANEYSSSKFGVQWKSGVYLVLTDSELTGDAFHGSSQSSEETATATEITTSTAPSTTTSTAPAPSTTTAGSTAPVPSTTTTIADGIEPEPESEYISQTVSNSALKEYNSRNPFDLHIRISAAGDANKLTTIKSYSEYATFTVLAAEMKASGNEVDPNINFVVGESVVVSYPEDKFDDMAMSFEIPSKLANKSTFYDYDYGNERYGVLYMNDDDRWGVVDYYNTDSLVLFTAEPGNIYFLVDIDAFFYNFKEDPADYNV